MALVFTLPLNITSASLATIKVVEKLSKRTSLLFVYDILIFYKLTEMTSLYDFASLYFCVQVSFLCFLFF